MLQIFNNPQTSRITTITSSIPNKSNSKLKSISSSLEILQKNKRKATRTSRRSSNTLVRTRKRDSPTSNFIPPHLFIIEPDNSGYEFLEKSQIATYKQSKSLDTYHCKYQNISLNIIIRIKIINTKN